MEDVWNYSIFLPIYEILKMKPNEADSYSRFGFHQPASWKVKLLSDCIFYVCKFLSFKKFDLLIFFVYIATPKALTMVKTLDIAQITNTIVQT